MIWITLIHYPDWMARAECVKRTNPRNPIRVIRAIRAILN
jgi:hypothetical protein